MQRYHARELAAMPIAYGCSAPEEGNLPATYKLTHQQSGQYYLGSTGDIRARINSHNTQLRRGVHRSAKLQELCYTSPHIVCHYRVYASKEEALSEEERLLAEASSDPLCVNRAPHASSVRGIVHSNEFRKKVSKAQSGENNSFFGKVHTEETRRLISEKLSGDSSPLKGRVKTPEHRSRLSESLRANGKVALGNNPRAKAVMINGQEYSTILEASNALGIERTTMRKRIISTDPMYAGYYFKESAHHA